MRALLRKHFFPLATFSLLALAVVYPILHTSGQIFLLDFSLPPTLDFTALMHSDLTNSLPVKALLVLLGTVFSVAVVSKLFVVFVLLFPMWTMYFLLRGETKRIYAVLGGILFLFNPFMYERFLAGHFFVMLGLGYLPLVLYFLRRTLATNSYRHSALFGLVLALYPIVSLHYAYIGIALTLLYILVHLATRTHTHIFSRKYALHGVLVLAIVLVVNSFWLASFFQSGGTFRAIDQQDFATFVTRGDSTLCVYGNVVALYGFWREGAVLPKDMLSLWWLPSLVILCFALVGLVARARKHDKLAWVLMIVSPVTLVLAVGFATPFSEVVTRFMMQILPGFTGLRETAKLTGVFALLYAYMVPFGVASVTHYIYRDKEQVSIALASMLAVCALATSFTFFGGALGQVAVANYPVGWNVVETTLAHDPSRGKVLVFPWRGYMEMNFANDVFIANPTPGYFSFPVITSTSINNTQYDKKYITPYDAYIPIDKSHEEVIADIAQLKSMGVTHIILLRTSDFARYLAALNDTEYVEEVTSDNSISLYRLR